MRKIAVRILLYGAWVVVLAVLFILIQAVETADDGEMDGRAVQAIQNSQLSEAEVIIKLQESFAFGADVNGKPPAKWHLAPYLASYLHIAIYGRDYPGRGEVQYMPPTRDDGESYERIMRMRREPVPFPRMALIKFLVEEGAEVNVQSDIGETPLTLAVREGYVDLATYLISKEADVNFKSSGPGLYL